LENIFPSQKEHLKFPFLPVPLQKEHVKFEVPDPLQEPHTAGGCPPPEPGAVAEPVCPVPLQEKHLPNIFPLQKEHLKEPLLPVPLQKEQAKREVPEPLQDPHSAAKQAGGTSASSPQLQTSSNHRQTLRIRCIKVR
jgi:hypothetical protein